MFSADLDVSLPSKNVKPPQVLLLILSQHVSEFVTKLLVLSTVTSVTSSFSFLKHDLLFLGFLRSGRSLECIDVGRLYSRTCLRKLYGPVHALYTNRLNSRFVNLLLLINGITHHTHKRPP